MKNVCNRSEFVAYYGLLEVFYWDGVNYLSKLSILYSLIDILG